MKLKADGEAKALAMSRAKCSIVRKCMCKDTGLDPDLLNFAHLADFVDFSHLVDFANFMDYADFVDFACPWGQLSLKDRRSV
jgi:hypothetical protein